MSESEYIARAIRLAQNLRSVIIKVVAVEKDREDFEREEDEYEASDEHMEDVLGSFNEGLKTADPATDLLAQIDHLLYALMDYEPVGEGWHDEDEYKTKEIMKLKEILPAPAA